MPAVEANGSVQMSVQEPQNQMSVQMSVQQNDDLRSTQHKVDLATKIQGQMQKPAANCGSSNDWKVPPRGVQPEAGNAENTGENAISNHLEEDECANECADTPKIQLQDLLKLHLPDEVLLKIIRHIQNPND